MEDIMSSYSFSHQFYQHWTRAPEPIRAAIVQELTDIDTLLQPDTPFETFVFKEPDLDHHIDKLYNTYKAQQAAAKEKADKQAQQVAEQQRLEEKKQAEADKVKAETKLKAEKELKSQKDAQQQDKAADKDSTTEQVVNNKTTDNKASNNQPNNNDDHKAASTVNSNDDTIHDNSSVVNDKSKDLATGQLATDSNAPKQTAAIEHLPKTPKLSKDNEDLIHELGVHIDDYLSEQMAQLSEDLKSWLRAEISRQLGTHNTQEKTTESVDKKNSH